MKWCREGERKGRHTSNMKRRRRKKKTPETSVELMKGEPMGDGGEDGIALRQLLSFSVLSMKQRGIFFFFYVPFRPNGKKSKTLNFAESL